MKSRSAVLGTTLVCMTAILALVPIAAATTSAGTFTFVPIQPISGRTFFYGGSTMPIKFQLFDSNGNIVSTATATIWVNGAPGTTNGNANVGNNFRFDASSQQYIYQLSTKGLPVPGPNTITIAVSDGSTHSFIVTFH